MVSSTGLLLIAYLTIATNFIGDMFPCDVRNTLTNNVYAKHLVVFATIFFFVTNETSDPASTVSFRRYVWRTCYVYLLFVLSCNCDTRFLMPALGLLFVGEVIRAYTLRTTSDIARINKRLEQVRFACKIVAVVSLATGSLVYFSTKSLSEIGTIKCR